MFNTVPSGSGFNVLSIAAPIAAKRQEEFRNRLANMGMGGAVSNTFAPDGGMTSAGWPQTRNNALANYGGPTNAAAAASSGARDLLAKTLMAEAGGEGLQGMLAAGAVINNRAQAGGYGDGLEGVIMKPGQFSAWNSVTGYAGGEGGLDMGRISPSEDAYRAADMILSGNYQDPTGGATHYYNPSVADPKWGQRAGGDWTRIGNHIFGFADAGRRPQRAESQSSDQSFDALAYLGL